MSVVIDSNLLVRTATDPTDGAVISRPLLDWRRAGETLHAPWLLRYEVANALARYVAMGELGQDDAEAAWGQVARLRRSVAFHDIADGPRVIAVAQALRRENAYDAAYVALAQELDANCGRSTARSPARTPRSPAPSSIRRSRRPRPPPCRFRNLPSCFKYTTLEILLH